MKKFLVLCLCGVLLFSAMALCGCDKNDSSSEITSSNSSHSKPERESGWTDFY